MAADERKPGPPERPDRPDRPTRQPPRSLLVWWLVLTSLLVWNVFAFWPKLTPEAEIPYSAFLGQVRAGNVAQVLIVGERITGRFKHPVTWPPEAAAETQPKSEAAKPTSYTAFRTAVPSVVGDPNLLRLLQAHHVGVDARPATAPWFVDLLSGWAPLLLLVGVFWWMGRQASRNQAGIFGFGRSRARRYSSDRPQVTFNDVAGADEAKAELQEEVDFLRRPQKYHDLGARIPRGVLLVGPPGTGKTLLARAVAGEAGVPFFSLSGSEFVEMFVG